MKVFVLEKRTGIAVIVAENASVALEVLAQKEKDPYLSCNTSVGDLKEIDPNIEARGVVAYYAD